MTELAVYEARTAALAIPDHRDIDSWINVVSDVIKIANVIYDTPFVPDGLRGSPPAVAAAILAGREMGLGVMTSLANIDVINGKPSQKALLMRAMILSKGHKWQDGDVSDVRAVVRGCRKGESEWAEVTFTAAQAKTAGIDLGKYPADKLYARATSRLARRKFADVIMGMPYSAEELEDGDTDEGTVTEVNGSAPAIEQKPAQRTARRARAAPDRPTPAPTAGATEPITGRATVPAATSPSLPPLPGEEENPGPAASDRAEAAAGPGPTSPPQQDTASPQSGSATADDPDQPGTATRGKGGQLTAIWTILRQVFGFEELEKDAARSVCEHILNRDLGGTTGNMSRNEAGTVLDTLANWQKIAESRGDAPRDVMISVMAEGGSDA